MSDALVEREDVDWRRLSDRLVETVRAQTGGPNAASPQRAAARAPQILGPLTDVLHEPDTVTDALKIAVDKDRLVAYRDREGRVRYLVADTAAARNLRDEERERDGPPHPPALRAAAHAAAQADAVDRDLVGDLNRLLARAEAGYE
jgi:hypothetical protein